MELGDSGGRGITTVGQGLYASLLQLPAPLVSIPAHITSPKIPPLHRTYTHLNDALAKRRLPSHHGGAPAVLERPRQHLGGAGGAAVGQHRQRSGGIHHGALSRVNVAHAGAAAVGVGVGWSRHEVVTEAARQRLWQGLEWETWRARGACGTGQTDSHRLPSPPPLAPHPQNKTHTPVRYEHDVAPVDQHAPDLHACGEQPTTVVADIEHQVVDALRGQSGSRSASW